MNTSDRRYEGRVLKPFARLLTGRQSDFLRLITSPRYQEGRPFVVLTRLGATPTIYYANEAPVPVAIDCLDLDQLSQLGLIVMRSSGSDHYIKPTAWGIEVGTTWSSGPLDGGTDIDPVLIDPAGPADPSSLRNYRLKLLSDYKNKTGVRWTTQYTTAQVRGHTAATNQSFANGSAANFRRQARRPLTWRDFLSTDNFRPTIKDKSTKKGLANSRVLGALRPDSGPSDADGRATANHQISACSTLVVHSESLRLLSPHRRQICPMLS
jgi:hypothetical protein